MHLWILYRIAALLLVPLENQHAAFCKFHERRLGRIHKLRCRVHWIQCLAEANHNDQPLTSEYRGHGTAANEQRLPSSPVIRPSRSA